MGPAQAPLLFKKLEEVTMYDKRVGISTAQFRAEEKGNKKFIEGTFIVFNQQTRLTAELYEEIAPEAIPANVGNVRALYNHNMDLVLGTTDNRTLTLTKTDKGLRGRIEINQADQAAMAAYARVKRGDIKGASFGFVILEEEHRSEGGKDIFRVTKLKLYEVSPCVFPAYSQTSIEARKSDLKRVTEKERVEARRAERRSKPLAQRRKELSERIMRMKHSKP